ncbi:hypothetical protein BKA62DRAFT_667091 [Auriculariales sp. MPI-PUGE-AT-0066]|nr:hypothetical protein BKA62DRAFT_667091 [Auriculariales sp. MPI-PUGE-AT-0066]
MPSLPFFAKKKEDSTSESAAPVTDAPTAEPVVDAVAAPVTDTPATEAALATSEASELPTTEKTVIEPPKRSFFGRRKSTDNGASESESESGAAHSRIPSLFGRKAKPTPTTVKEEEKENVPAESTAAAETTPAVVAEVIAPASDKKDSDKVEEKVRRRISLFQRRNREGGVSEGEVTDGEKDAALKAKRTSFWKAATPAEKEDIKEPVTEDPRVTEAKTKVNESTEAEANARIAYETAKKAVRDSKAALKAIEVEVAAEIKKARTTKKDEVKLEEVIAPQTAIEPPILPQVTATA